MYSHSHIYFLLSALLLLLGAHAQNAALGGAAGAGAAAPVQYPVVINGPSLLTQAGTTTTVQQAFTQTFVTPLATWAFATPEVGSVGLGSIQGQIGTVKGS